MTREFGKRVRARRSLSQNFLVDPNLCRKLVATLAADSGDTVLEVGPGHGELSEHLAGRIRRLVLVEKDDRLAPLLRERWGERRDVEIVHADALDCDLGALVRGAPVLRVMSNLPYSITTPLLFRLLDLRPRPRRLVLLVQREVAARVTSPAGSKRYGALSVGVQVRATARSPFGVPRSAFRPAPRVDSAALVLDPRPDEPPEPDLAALRTLVRVAFSRRRKQLQRILRDAPEFGLDAETAEAVLARAGIDPAGRPESVAPGGFLVLSRLLQSEPPGRRGGKGAS
ncbi:MAG: 16S rRNA (adenine(1518)-N(6)/adenine(1519)-N(6))-dimethyltransferase RsmA [Gemmatimonadota bacterium]|nr:16S rRNA (adenine(1518)-N(6)/adenine(1519)-N(6))-dimethyltransferase RsmA [Gemmatimonadota bacterium]